MCSPFRRGEVDYFEQILHNVGSQCGVRSAYPPYTAVGGLRAASCPPSASCRVRVFGAIQAAVVDCCALPFVAARPIEQILYIVGSKRVASVHPSSVRLLEALSRWQ